MNCREAPFKTMWNSEPAFISSMIDTVVWIIWRVGSVSMTLRFWHLQRAWKVGGFYVEGVMPVWKESLEGVGLNCPDFDGKPFQTSFQTNIIVGFLYELLSNGLNWNIRQNVVEICIKPRSCKRRTLNMVSKYLKWYTQGAAASCSMPCCTVFTYKTIIEATFLSKIQAKYLEA